MKAGIFAAALALASPIATIVAPPAWAQQNSELTPVTIRAAAAELADLLEQNYVFPEQARAYAQHLRERAGVGAYDALTASSDFAATLQDELRALHEDAHLRVEVLSQEDSAPHPQHAGNGAAIGDDIWLAPGIGYFRSRGLPGDAESIAAMTRIVDEFASAHTLIVDVRACPGGGLREMDVLFSRLFAAPTHLVTMDTRARANANLEEPFEASPTLRRADAPETVSRREHWAAPAEPATALRNARVYLLTDFTASACEHLALALKESGRANLVGATTRGAGHYGGEHAFGGGRFSVFLPVGRTFAPSTGLDWEGAGITPHQAVAPAEALDAVLRQIGVPVEAAQAISPLANPVIRRVVETAPGRRAYGIGLIPPRAGDTFVRVEETAPGMVAEQAGIHAGDRIVAINGVAIADMTPAEFRAAMRSSPMRMVVERSGERLTIDMRLE